MNVFVQITTIIAVLGLALLLVRSILSWQVSRAKKSILAELRFHSADSPEKAVVLNYNKPFWQRVGLRDYRPFVLNALVQNGQIHQTADGRFYLGREANK